MSEAPAKAIYLKDYTPPSFLIKETFLDFELLEEHTLVHSRLRVERNPNATAQDNRFVLDGHDVELIAVALDGESLSTEDYTLTAATLELDVDRDDFVFECTTRIYPHKNTALEGLYISGGMYCTQCEAEGFRRITYFQDRPDVLSVFTTRITVDAEKYPVALSNGNLVSRSVADGKVVAEWHDPFPKPSYLFALVSGDLICNEDKFITQSGRTIQLQIFVEEGNEHKCEHALESLKRSMAWDEQTYGREYDLDLFMIVAVDHFNMGAMENKGLNIFNSSCVLATPETATDDAYARIEGIVGHEYFHNWSGNRVTCRDWFQLSLKEGFTVFRDAEFSADMGSRAVKRLEDVSFLRQHQFPEDAGPMAHAVRPASYIEISNFYTVTIYEKGSEVVRMLHTMLGAELFRKGSDLYFDTFDGMAVTTDDFVWSMQQVSGRDLSQFKRWYTQAGTPRLTITREYNASNKSLVLKAVQSTPASADGSGKLPFVIPVVLGALDSKGEPVRLSSEDISFDQERSVWLVTEQEQTIQFNELDQQPVLSLLRDFSAPVLLQDDLADEERVILIANDPNGFNRWEQCQALYKKLILQAVESDFDDGLLSDLVKSLGFLLQDSSVENAVKAELLSLPAESEFLQLSPGVDILAVAKARKRLRKRIALELKEVLKKTHDSLTRSEVYVFNPQQVGSRKLGNVVLEYLLLTDLKEYEPSVLSQYASANNMTDQLAAFKLISLYSSLDVVNQISDKFLTQWQHDTQVLEQWFRVGVSRSDEFTLDRVKKLLTHDLFEYENPNKVRAVIGAFAMLNVDGFHGSKGEGYIFLREQVEKLDAMNPQIAARLVGPLVKWRSYDKSRGELMRQQLQILSNSNLSKDLYEVVSKSLT